MVCRLYPAAGVLLQLLRFCFECFWHLLTYEAVDFMTIEKQNFWGHCNIPGPRTSAVSLEFLTVFSRIPLLLLKYTSLFVGIQPYPQPYPGIELYICFFFVTAFSRLLVFSPSIFKQFHKKHSLCISS